MINLEENKERFILLTLHSTHNSISDYSAVDIITYLDEETDFFKAPASTQYHGAYAGGLCEHSLNVYDNIFQLNKLFFPLNSPFSEKSLSIVSLFHDICKVNIYQNEFRNKKKIDNEGKDILNEKGKQIWETIKSYKVVDDLPLGHGEKSVIILQKYFDLTKDEIIAIRWHMGGYDDLAKTHIGNLTANNAFNNYPLVSLLHMADLASIFLKPLSSEIEQLTENQAVFVKCETDEDLIKDAF